MATGPADPAAVRVIRRWLATLRRGDTHGAARFFALPSRFQNGTPVLLVDTELKRIAVNEALPCGARMGGAGGAGAYTIVVYVLMRRPGGDCGSGVGAPRGRACASPAATSPSGTVCRHAAGAGATRRRPTAPRSSGRAPAYRRGSRST